MSEVDKKEKTIKKNKNKGERGKFRRKGIVSFITSITWLLVDFPRVT